MIFYGRGSLQALFTYDTNALDARPGIYMNAFSFTRGHSWHAEGHLAPLRVVIIFASTTLELET